MWIKNVQNNDWFDLLRLNLDSPYFENAYGVYMIWLSAPGKSKAIKISFGRLKDKLSGDRANPEILRFSSQGALKVSWLDDPKTQKEAEGKASYLQDHYSPFLSQSFTEQSINAPLLS